MDHISKILVANYTFYVEINKKKYLIIIMSISSYRLGDLVLVYLNENEMIDLVLDYPDSIGSKFIFNKYNNPNTNNIDLITNIVLEFIEKYKYLIPNDIDESTLIHVRLGDVVCGNQYHEIAKRPYEFDQILNVIKDDYNKKYIIGKCFFAKTSSPNYDECISLSNYYLQNLLSLTNSIHFDSGNADIDLCCAVKCKRFIKGKGYFSELIYEIRKKLNLESITII